MLRKLYLPHVHKTNEQLEFNLNHELRKSVFAIEKLTNALR